MHTVLLASVLCCSYVTLKKIKTRSKCPLRQGVNDSKDAVDLTQSDSKPNGVTRPFGSLLVRLINFAADGSVSAATRRLKRTYLPIFQAKNPPGQRRKMVFLGRGLLEVSRRHHSSTPSLALLYHLDTLVCTTDL